MSLGTVQSAERCPCCLGMGDHSVCDQDENETLFSCCKCDGDGVISPSERSDTPPTSPPETGNPAESIPDAEATGAATDDGADLDAPGRPTRHDEDDERPWSAREIAETKREDDEDRRRRFGEAWYFGVD